MSSASTKPETAFTARDFQLLAKAMGCTKEPIAVDYAKFAEVGGFKNSNSAKASWHSLKKKLEKAGEGSVSYSGEPDTADAPKSKKRKSTGGDDDGSEETTVPAAKSVKKGRKPKTPSAAEKKAKADALAVVEEPEDGATVKEEAGGEDEGDAEDNVKDEPVNGE